MPDDKPPKRKPGRPPFRTFHTTIGFHLTSALHEAMKALATERGVNLEDVYREAALSFLERRGAGEATTYLAAPQARSATRVAVPMADELCARLREAARSDHQSLGNVFETATRLYLAALDLRDS